MPLSLGLVLTPSSQPHIRINVYEDRDPIGAVDVDGMSIHAERASDLANLGKALIEAAERLAASGVNQAAQRCTKCSAPLHDDDPSSTGLGYHVDCTADGALAGQPS